MGYFQHRCRLRHFAAIGLLVSNFWGIPATAYADSKVNEPLRISLTNDDGWNAAGITAMYEALVAAD